MTTDINASVRPLKEILYRGSPRRHESKSLNGKIRRGEKKKALCQISEIFRCNDAEAEVVFQALKELAVGFPTALIEIPLSEVTAFKGRLSDNPLTPVPQFLARSGCYVGLLAFNEEYGHTINGEAVRKSEIDQVWKVVQKA